jgi:arsenate reductase
MKNILFLCTGNSCRSVLAEAYISAASQGAWRGFSAGSQPTGQVHPMALATLRDLGLPDAGYRSQSWDDFATAPAMDVIVTVCDNAAGETCPVWPGHPATYHWPFPDPAAFQGDEAQVAAHFLDVMNLIKAKIDAFLADPTRGARQ